MKTIYVSVYCSFVVKYKGTIFNSLLDQRDLMSLSVHSERVYQAPSLYSSSLLNP